MTDDTPREHLAGPSPNRIVLLAIVTAAGALAMQLGLIALGLGRENPIRLLLVPILGGLVVYFGLRGYPMSGRIRLSVMVAVFLLLFAGVA